MAEGKTTYQTDLNQRERQKYAEELQLASDAALKLAEALLSEDDDTAMIQYIIFSFASAGMRELGKVFTAAADAAKMVSELDADLDRLQP